MNMGGWGKPLLVQINQLESFIFSPKSWQRAGKTKTGGDHPPSALQLSAYRMYPGFGRPGLGPGSAQPPSDPGDGLPCPGHTCTLSSHFISGRSRSISWSQVCSLLGRRLRHEAAVLTPCPGEQAEHLALWKFIFQFSRRERRCCSAGQPGLPLGMQHTTTPLCALPGYSLLKNSSGLHPSCFKEATNHLDAGFFTLIFLCSLP